MNELETDGHTDVRTDRRTDKNGKVSYRPAPLVISRPSKARGCSTNSFVGKVIKSWFVKISLRRRHTLLVADCAFNHKMDYVKKCRRF